MKPGESDGDDDRATRASLLARLRNHEHASAWQQGWSEFLQAYQGILLRYARRHGLSSEDAEDVVQEIVAGVAARLPGFCYDRSRCRFQTWLFRIARNKVLDHQRRVRRRGQAGFEESPPEPTTPEIEDPGVLAPDAAWELEFETGLRRVALERVARRVDPMNMRLYLYHVVDGHDVSETVRRFRDSGITAARVYLARHRIRGQVESELALLRRGAYQP